MSLAGFKSSNQLGLIDYERDTSGSRTAFGVARSRAARGLK